MCASLLCCLLALFIFGAPRFALVASVHLWGGPGSFPLEPQAVSPQQLRWFGAAFREGCVGFWRVVGISPGLFPALGCSVAIEETMVFSPECHPPSIQKGHTPDTFFFFFIWGGGGALPHRAYKATTHAWKGGRVISCTCTHASTTTCPLGK